MNETQTFLFRSLAQAASLEEFHMIYLSIRRLQTLLAQSEATTQALNRRQQPEIQHGAGPVTNGAGPIIPPYMPPPIGPRPFRAEDLSPDYDSMPWEGGQ